MFADRVDAGSALAAKLSAYVGAPDTVVLGIPRGGVVVGAVVAQTLRLPLDIVLAAKIGAPGNPEFAVGAMTADGEVLPNPTVGLSARQLDEIAGPAREKIAHQLVALRGALPPLVIAGLTTIVVDDGLATGLTALAAVRYLHRQNAEKVVLAVPVAAEDSARRMRPEVDELVVVEMPHSFMAVGQFYQRFDQTSDDEVRRLLARAS